MNKSTAISPVRIRKATKRSVKINTVLVCVVAHPSGCVHIRVLDGQNQINDYLISSTKIPTEQKYTMR